MSVRLEIGDCTRILPRLRREHLLVDAVVTDPPYHLASIVDRLGKPGSAPIKSGATGVYARSSRGFMGKEWDGGDVAFRPETWSTIASVMKPGAHLIAFGGTRTYHRLACAIEDAGFEIRDQIGWLYGSGFPKSHNLEGDWKGWGTALKPAWEPIVLARRPCDSSIPENVARHGVGAINIDACRVPPTGEKMSGGQTDAGIKPDTHNEGWQRPWMRDPDAAARHQEKLKRNREHAETNGRWPANVVHDGSEEVLSSFASFGNRGAIAPVHRRGSDKFRNTYGAFAGNVDEGGSTFRGDSGTAARFFYSAKASAADRAGSKHPTVKPVALMAWLCRLVTPPGGLILDPFAGTGTTAAAALQEGFECLLIERDVEYARDIGRRLGLPVAELTAAEVGQRGDHGPLFSGASA